MNHSSLSLWLLFFYVQLRVVFYWDRATYFFALSTWWHWTISSLLVVVLYLLKYLLCTTYSAALLTSNFSSRLSFLLPNNTLVNVVCVVIAYNNCKVKGHFMSLLLYPLLPALNVPCPRHLPGTVSGHHHHHYHSCPDSRIRCHRSVRCSLRRCRRAPPAFASPSPFLPHVVSATWCAGSGTRPAKGQRKVAKDEHKSHFFPFISGN